MSKIFLHICRSAIKMGYKKRYPDSTSYTSYICGVETIATSAIDTICCAIKAMLASHQIIKITHHLHRNALTFAEQR